MPEVVSVQNGILVGLGVLTLILGSVFFLIARGSREREALAKLLKDINSIPFEVAKQNAYELLQDALRFKCSQDTSTTAVALETLGSSLRDIFQNFRSIECAIGERARLSRDFLDCRTMPGFILVGRGMEGTDTEYELGAQLGSEEIVLLYPGEPTDPQFGTYASAFHWVIAAARGH